MVDIDVGHRHSAAVGDGGELYTWGEGDYGRLGTQLKTKKTPQNQIINNTEKADHVHIAK